MKIPLVLPAALALLAASCGGGPEQPLSRIFEQPSWGAGEELFYTVRDRDDVRGSCRLAVADADEPGTIRLLTYCANPDSSWIDERTVVTEETTLRPIASERTVHNVEEGSNTIYTADYGVERVTLVARSGSHRNETERDLPAASAEVPEPGYYDDASLFWLVRGAPLDAGFDRTFLDVNPGNARTVRVQLVVTGGETVTVPAGTFDAWRVELRTGSITQIMWVEKMSPRRVVLARIEGEFHELRSIPTAP